jgi:hypothetical protein
LASSGWKERSKKKTTGREGRARGCSWDAYLILRRQLSPARCTAIYGIQRWSEVSASASEQVSWTVRACCFVVEKEGERQHGELSVVELCHRLGCLLSMMLLCVRAC